MSAINEITEPSKNYTPEYVENLIKNYTDSKILMNAAINRTVFGVLDKKLAEMQAVHYPMQNRSQWALLVAAKSSRNANSPHVWQVISHTTAGELFLGAIYTKLIHRETIRQAINLANTLVPDPLLSLDKATEIALERYDSRAEKELWALKGYSDQLRTIEARLKQSIQNIKTSPISSQLADLIPTLEAAQSKVVEEKIRFYEIAKKLEELWA